MTDPKMPHDLPAEPDVPQRPGRLPALAYRALGLVMLALAAAGFVLPGLPGTPFLLLAVWALSKGDPELKRRVEAHPRYGPVIANWRARRVVPRKAKIAAITSMAISFTLLALTGAGVALLGLVGSILVGVAAYLLSRPSV